MAVTLRPFRDYDEKDVINLFALDTTSLDTAITTWATRATAGSLVKLSTAGWHADKASIVDMEAISGAHSVQNVTSQNWGVQAKVEITDAASDIVLGMMLNHVALYDENGEQLQYNPRKASELEAVLPWQAVPIVRKGMFLLDSPQLSGETFNAGARLTCMANAVDGEWTTGSNATTDTLVGYTLGNNHGTVGNADHHTQHLVLLDVTAGMAA
jgi:hypothetical protein